MKQFKLLRILSSLPVILTFFSCTKETLSLKGKMYDVKSNKIINQAQISIGDVRIKSNAAGEFKIPGLKTNKEYIITIEHANYVSMTRKIKFNVAKKMDLNFTLIPRSTEKQFDSGDSIIVPLMEGGEINIRPNSFIAKSAGRYKGKVNLRVTYINPKDNSAIVASPGIFMSSDNQPLQTYGMVEIYATTPKGERLEIMERSPIKLMMPNLTGIVSNVGLYSLNTSTGLWDKKGELLFDKQTNTLLGQVTSISSAWNADDPCTQNPVCVQFQFVDVQGNPIIQMVAVKGVSYSGFGGWFQTDANGFANFQVCPNQVFKVVTGLIPCCGPEDIPGTPQHDACCINGGMIYGPVIDMNTVTLNPSGCTFLGQVTL